MIHKTRIHGMSHLFFSLVDVYCDFLSVRMMSLLSIFALKGGHISMKFLGGGDVSGTLVSCKIYRHSGEVDSSTVNFSTLLYCASKM